MTGSIWERPQHWPKLPSAYVFLAAAFDRVGRNLFGTRWEGSEWQRPPSPKADAMRRSIGLFRQMMVMPAAVVGRSSGGVALDAETARLGIAKVEQEGAAELEQERAVNDARLARRREVAAWIADRCREGSLVTHGLEAGGGAAPVGLPTHVWNISDDWSIFADCSATFPSHGIGRPNRYWLFLDGSELEAALKAHKMAPETPIQLRTGEPGRPSLGREIYMSKFRERAGACEVLEGCAAESRWLNNWFSKEYPSQQAPTAKTIENHIRGEHRVATKAPPKLSAEG